MTTTTSHLTALHESHSRVERDVVGPRGETLRVPYQGSATSIKVGTKVVKTSSSSDSGSDSNLSPASGSSCKASYYWQGQMTANGERFNPSSMTAAHKTFKFGTKVKVTNPRNGKTGVVRINDHGPYISGRCLDLSKAAMQAIGGTSAGVITVKYEVVS